MGASEPTLQVIRDAAESPPSADYWHTDVTWTAEPPKLALLRATLVPDRGGDTMWGSMTAAYEALSPPIRTLFDGLEIYHDNTSFIEGTIEKLGAQRVEELGIASALRKKHPGVCHPLVRTHPDTGRRALLHGGNFMRHVVGVGALESAALLSLVRAHVDQPRFHCRWRWQLDDFAIWDERSTVHRALSDHYPRPREVRRCVVDGDRPFFDAHQMRGARS
jgi:taurine dioxygenase